MFTKKIVWKEKRMNKLSGVRSVKRSRVVKKYFISRISVVLLAIFAIWLVAFPKVTASATTEKLVSYTVRPGDTLWGYAKSINDGGDISDDVERLMEINHLSSYDLQVGQIINVPVIEK